ncbi:hypothetical protein Dda_7426 [Drechslerella dactyloides]|uniref:Uncharacterized protein n=1 Tax=Drechslerella dactyloides TaxID=74499 RepID=A0AAD6IS80_DREDA|nr:hypothetical protein Dda_7426 [Drechslerella dactyloides]
MRATDYDEVKKKLMKMGIEVLPGPLTTDRAGRIASEMFHAGYDSILAGNLRFKTVRNPLQATRDDDAGSDPLTLYGPDILTLRPTQAYTNMFHPITISWATWPKPLLFSDDKHFFRS